MSRDVRAGVELPDALMEGCLLRLLGWIVAAALSADACDTPWPPMMLPA